MPVNPISEWSAAARGAGLLAAGLVASLAIGSPQDPPAEDPPATTQAQVQEGAPVDQPGVVMGEDVAQGVFVRDSAIAVDQVALAERMERLRDWTKAADVYQDVLSRFGDLLIADRADGNGKVYQYASVGRAVQRKLAAWPPEGLAVYEQKFGMPAQTLLKQARQASPADDEQLQQVVRLYFVTEAGREAAILLIDRHLAEGSFAAARRLSREVLEMHPALGEHRAGALLRAAIAAHFLGDSDQAVAYAQELSEQFPQAKAVIAGEERVIADVARAVLQSAPPGSAEVAGDGWPTFGGSDDRSRLAHPLSSQIAPYVQDIRVPEIRPGDTPLNASLKRESENARQNGQLTGIFPVAYDGALFWSDNVHVYAVALDSGLPLPGWLETYGGGGQPGYSLPGGGFVTPRGAALTPTVTERFVLANMGLRDERLFNASGNPSLGPAELVCLDRLSGRPIWGKEPSEVDGATLGDPALQADLGECQFVGTPLVIGDAVWTLARTDPMRGRQFEQSFIVSLDLESGETRTVTYIASSSGQGLAARWGQRIIVPEPTSLMAYADGLIYAPTDTGALAAVRVADGGVEWLNLYPRSDDQIRGVGAGRLRLRSRTESQPFHAAPVIVEGGRLFFKPPDADHVFIWNAADGDELARVDLTVTERIGQSERVRTVDGDTTLLKVMGDRILTFGPQGASCIDWTAVQAGQTALQATRWSSRIESPNGEDSVMGRPAVTRTQLLLPTREHLRVIQLEDGRFVATYPTGGAPWAENEEPGNVIALQDQLVIAGPSRLNIYADSAVIQNRLQKQVAADPKDPTPLLRLAQIAFVTGDFDATVERLRQAELAGDASGEPEAARGAVFASALNFAQTLAGRLGNVLAPGSPTPATVDRFFTLAEKFARTPAQNVRVRFARADFPDTEGGAQRRVALLQEILSDPAWRQVPAIPDTRDGAASGEASPRQASEVARELLTQLISQSGPQVYEQIELRAREELQDAIAAADVPALQRLAESYPNSAAASTALAEAARLLQADNRLADAATALRRLAARNDNPLEAWLTLAQIEASRPGRLGVAAGRLRKAARLSPDADAPAIKLANGTSLDGLTVEQAAFKLTEAALAEETAVLPDLRLPANPMKPLFSTEATAVAGIEALLVPAEGFGRSDRLVTRRSDGTLSLFGFGAAEPMWSVPVEPQSADAAAWVPEGLLIWGAGGLALLDADTGATRWRLAPGELSPARLLAEGGREGAVVASGWHPTPIEPEVAEVAAVAEQQLREMDLQRRGNRGFIIQRDQQRRNNQQRLELIAQLRRERDAGEQTAGAVMAGEPDALLVAAVLPGAETITVILAGAPNGVAGVATAGGEVRWRAPLPAGELVAVSGAGDYVAVQADESRSVLSVLDLDDGSLVTRRSFEADGAEPLINFAITPESELVFVTRRQVVGVDLEGDRRASRFTVRTNPTLGENENAFGVATGEGRLKVVGGRLLVLADPTQSGRRDALVIDLAKGALETYADDATDEQHHLLLTAAESLEEGIEEELPPRMRDQQRQRRQQARRDAIRAMGEAGLPGERIWTAGNSVYLTADRGLSAYDLDLPGRQWKRLNAPMMREFDPAANLAVAIGKDDLLLFDRPLPTPRRQIEEPALRLTVFSRERLPDGRESGQQRHEVMLIPGVHGLDAPVGAFQPMAGGLALLSESGRLLFLRGAE